jgi:FKBP-type peptidyl-prolyl cis-trans isomerase
MSAAVGERRFRKPDESPLRAGSILTAAACTGLAAALLLGSPGTTAQNAAPDKAPASNATAPATTSATAQPKKSTAKAPATGGTANMKAPVNAKAKASYSIGVSMGEQLHRLGLTSDSVATERLTQGLRDALAGKVTMSNEDQENIANVIKSARNGLADTNHAAARAFLAENGKKPDVVTTASGLQYHVINGGDGPSPKSTDEVTVNYRGTLLDGTEFDSSYKRGQPASFPVNGVIPGWQEALVLMKPGAKWQLFIPPALAYDVNSPPTIPPGSMLVFDVELIRVKPPTAQAPAPAFPSSKVPTPQ